MKPPVPVLLVLFLCLLAAGNASAATLTVTKTEDTNDAVCDADCSLREAITAAASGDTVVFSALFNTPQTITLTLGHIIIDKNLTINGTGQNLVTISGNNAGRIFFVNMGGVTVNLAAMTFRDGNVGPLGDFDAYGGAIAVIESTLNVSNASFINNRAFNTQCSCGEGGAIWGTENSSFTLSYIFVTGNFSLAPAVWGYSTIDIRDSIVKQNSSGGVGSRMTLLVERSIISDNLGLGAHAGRNLSVFDSTIISNNDGGLTSGDSLSTMTIERCLISGNRSFSGGGVTSSGLNIIKDTQITNNTADGYGGGGIVQDGTLYLINSVVSGNRNTGSIFGIDGGGGIVTYGGNSLFVINSTISGNIAMGNPGVGGGIYALANEATSGSHIYLVNSTIADNTSVGGGGGVKIDANAHGTFSNTIVAGNNSTGTTQEDVSGVIMSNGINLIGNTVGSSGWMMNDLLNVNPLLGPLGNNGGLTLTRALLRGSPAINSGDNALAVDPLTMLPLETDQRGRARFSGGKNQTVDIGSYEASYSSSPVTVSGRFTTFSGRGIDRARIKIDDGQGNISYAQTNPFGFFRFNNLTPGTTYTITVTHKFYLFPSPQLFTADQNRSDLNFVTGL